MKQPVKACKRCQETLPLWQFYRDRYTPDKLDIYCKDCHGKAKKKTEVQKLRDKMPRQVAYKGI